VAERCDTPADRRYADIDAVGTFTFARVPIGEYRIWLETWGREVVTEPVTVQVSANTRAIARPPSHTTP
jgi:hypothetical protein